MRVAQRFPDTCRRSLQQVDHYSSINAIDLSSQVDAAIQNNILKIAAMSAYYAQGVHHAIVVFEEDNA